MQLARSSLQIGNAIRRERKKLGWSQQALGIRAGLRQEAVSQIETGKTSAKLGRILDLLAALDLEFRVSPRTKMTDRDMEKIF